MVHACMRVQMSMLEIRPGTGRNTADIRDEPLWELLAAFKPLMSTSLPGDFLRASCGGHFMKQLIVCGAKLHTVMKRLFATGPAPIDGEVEADVLVDWLLAAVASAVVCEQAQRQHGQIACACGPTAFLIALGVISKTQPGEDAAP